MEHFFRKRVSIICLPSWSKSFSSFSSFRHGTHDNGIGCCTCQPVLPVAAGWVMCTEDWILTQLFRQMTDVPPHGERWGERERESKEDVPLQVTGAVNLSHLRRMWCKALLLEEASTHMFLYWYTKALRYVLHWAANSCEWNVHVFTKCTQHRITWC